MVFNRSELPPNALGAIDDGEEEEDGDKKNSKKKTKTMAVSQNKKTVVEKIKKEKKNGTKIVTAKKVVNKEEGKDEKKKGRTTLSRSVKKLDTKTVLKSDINMTEIKEIKGKKLSKKLLVDEEEKRKETEVVENKVDVTGMKRGGSEGGRGRGKVKVNDNENENEKSEVEGKGISTVKRTITAASSSSIDDTQAFNDQDTGYPIPTAKRTRSSRTIQ